jgi:hypothetical protein
MKRPGYREAIEWLAGNDDCYWLAPDARGGISVAAALVRDLFGVDEEKFKRDLRRTLKKMQPNHEALR